MTLRKEIVRERVYPTFPKESVEEPIACTRVKQFDIVFNIRGATVTSEMGPVALELEFFCNCHRIRLLEVT
jgi:hypothetical protein